MISKLSLIFVSFLLLSCAGGRVIHVHNQTSMSILNEKEFYIALNSSTVEVKYNYLANMADYSKYGGGRKESEVKMDIPNEIANYLKKRNKNISVGPNSFHPSGDTVIVTYNELWGWDMGDIIKALDINFFKNPSSGDTLSVSFEEMTIINSHPTAKNLIPQMLDSLKIK